MSERLGVMEFPSKQEVLDSEFQRVKDSAFPNYAVSDLVLLAHEGHQPALEEALRLIQLPIDDYYGGRENRPSDRFSAVGDVALWRKEYDMGALAGALTRNGMIERAYDLVSQITSDDPRAFAYIQIGKAGHPNAFQGAISALKNRRSSHGRRDRYTEITDYLVENGDIETMSKLRGQLLAETVDVGEGHTVPLIDKIDYLSSMTQAAINAEEDEKVLSLVDELFGFEQTDASRLGVRALRTLASRGNKLALQKLFRAANTLQGGDRLETLIDAINIVEKNSSSL